LASSKVLHKLNVPFTYIENCQVEDEHLAKGLDTFLRAVNAAKVLRNGVRLGLVGQRIDFFWSTIINESELLERFNVEILPLDMVEFIDAALQRVEQNKKPYLQEVKALRRKYSVEGFESDTPLMNLLGVRDQMLALIETHGLDGLAFQTFMSIVNATGAYCSYAESVVSETLPFAGFPSGNSKARRSPNWHARLPRLFGRYL
jgi:L-fucose isomerase-like protein